MDKVVVPILPDSVYVGGMVSKAVATPSDQTATLKHISLWQAVLQKKAAYPMLMSIVMA
jgi:hypothetical protein